MTSIPWTEIPAIAANRLYMDYISGHESALQFYSHGPLELAEAFAQRRGFAYPRKDLATLIARYNRGIGAGERAIAAAESLGDPDTYCVIGGQQATMLTGPVMTTYKIATVIRLAANFERSLNVPVVPMFWLASEDHDFDEVNHLYYMKDDGEPGRVRFPWPEAGRPIADLPLTQEALSAYEEYFDRLPPGPQCEPTRTDFAPGAAADYSAWQAAILARTFARQGLVVVEPRVLRPLCGDFFAQALRREADVRTELRATAERLRSAGYEPSLDAETYGRLYTADGGGKRVRVENAGDHVDLAKAHPERYSTDAALRPVLADSLLPVLADVLGAGEIAYQGMLRPLYDLFGVPQPVLFPRKHYTVLSSDESDSLARYGVGVTEIVSERLDADAVFTRLAPESERDLFATASAGVAAALAPLRPYAGEVDPGLERTWEGTRAAATTAVTKLKARVFRARLSQLGYSRHELQTLRNLILPRGRLQERVLPLPHFLCKHGPSFLEALWHAGPLDHFAHHVLTLEDENDGD